jgi:hypothetical protein
VFSAPISVTTTQTIKAIAVATGFTQSAVGSASYVIGSSGGTFASFCGTTGTANLEVLASCLHANPDFLAAFVDDFVVFAGCDSLQKEIDAGRVSYDATSAAACASGMSGLTCEQFATETLPAACDSVLTGNVGDGGSCYVDEDCATGWCDASAATCPGTCNPFVQVGQSCAPVVAEVPRCAPDLECEATTNLCVALSPVNGPCPCADGLWCDTSGGTPGTCRTPQTSGACDPAAVDQCAFGYVCAGAPSTCTPFVGLDGDCSASPDVCGLGYICDAGTNRCVSWPKLGETCSTDRPLCIGGYCDLFGTQTCLAYKPVGAACTFPIDLVACEPGSVCDQGTSTCVAQALTCQAP